MMQKKTLFYITLNALLMWFSPAYASDVEEEQGKPHTPLLKKVKLPLKLPNTDTNATLQNNGAPISSPRRGPIETLSSPRNNPGESPRGWEKLLAGMPKQEETTEQPTILRKKSSVRKLQDGASSVVSPRAPKTPRQEGFTKPDEEKFQQGLKFEEQEKFKEALKSYKESFALGFKKASQKIGRLAYDLGIIQMAKEQKVSSDNVKFEQLSKRYSKIHKLFRTAEKHKFELARDKLIEIAQILGQSAQKDSYYQQARHFFIMGAERNDIMCLLKLGALISDKKLKDPFENYSWTAVKCYKRAALLGSLEGQVKYAEWAEKPIQREKSQQSTPRLLYEAILFYERAAKQDHLSFKQKIIQYQSQKLYIEKLFKEGEELFKKKDLPASLRSLKIAAEHGHLPAKLLTAQIYEEFGNKVEAKKLYQELSDLDDPEALCSLARLNEDSEDSEESKKKDIYEGETLLRKAIYLDYPLAYFDLGILYTRYARQLDTEESSANATKYFHEAILCFTSLLDYVRKKEENKHPVNRQYKAEANFNLSLLYKWNGRIGEEREYTKAAAELEHPQGMYNYGLLLADEGQSVKSRELILKAAKEGLPSAQVAMAEIETENGNIVEAAKWYQQAKFNKHPEIESILGDFLQQQLLKHIGGKDRKDKDACFVLGILYKVQENPKEAKKCLKISAQKNHAKAAFELGLLYEEERNIQKALLWQEKGASKEGKALAHWGCLLYMNHLSSEDKIKALKAIEEATGKGYFAGYQDLARQLEAVRKNEKVENFYQKDRALRAQSTSPRPE